MNPLVVSVVLWLILAAVVAWGWGRVRRVERARGRADAARDIENVRRWR